MAKSQVKPAKFEYANFNMPDGQVLKVRGLTSSKIIAQALQMLGMLNDEEIFTKLDNGVIDCSRCKTPTVEKAFSILKRYGFLPNQVHLKKSEAYSILVKMGLAEAVVVEVEPNKSGFTFGLSPIEAFAKTVLAQPTC